MYRILTNKFALPVILVATFLGFNYSHPQTTFYGDSLGYYMYLPTAIIYDNVKTIDNFRADKHVPNYILANANGIRNNKTSKGYTINQYTYGVALMESPFFFIAHAYEKIKGLDANGFSETYDLCNKTGSFVYAFLGLLLVLKILRKYFSEINAFIGTLLIFAGTNLFWFSIFQGGMSHTPLFFLYTLLILTVIRVYEKPTTLSFIVAGSISGMITLIRPTDMVCLLIPLLYNVYNRETLKAKMRFLTDNKWKVLIFIAAFIIPAIPQLLYWKAISGDYLFYSYGDQSFTWSHPRIIEGLFYFSNGWLPYSPIMIFALAGALLCKNYKQWAWCIWLIFLVYIYLIYSWFCYRYINGLGSRPMIHLYPLLALPLTAFIQYISKQNVVAKSVFAGISAFFIAVNICFSMQQDRKLLFSEESNMAFNLQMLFRLYLTHNDRVTFDLAEPQPNNSKTTKLLTLGCMNFDDPVSGHYAKDTVTGKGYVYKMGNDEYMQGIDVVYDSKKFRGAKWFKCSGKFMYPEFPNYFKHLLLLDIPGKSWKGCKIENKIADDRTDLILDYSEMNKWGYVYFYSRIPDHMKDGDVIKLYVWNGPKTELLMDDLCLELYK